jgi:hypothetical protein
MKTVAKFINPEEAKVARTFLASHGIEAYLNGEESLSVMPHLPMGAGSYYLMVAEEDEARTRQLLDEVEREHQISKAEQQGDGFSKKQLWLTLALVVTFLVLLIGNSYANDLNRHTRGLNDFIGEPTCLIGENWWN